MMVIQLQRWSAHFLEGEEYTKIGRQDLLCDGRLAIAMFASRLAEEKLERATGSDDVRRRYCCLGLSARDEGQSGLHEFIAAVQGDSRQREAARRRRS